MGAPKQWMAIVNGFSVLPNGCQNCETFNRTVILDFGSPSTPNEPDNLCRWLIEFDPALTANPCPECNGTGGQVSNRYQLDIFRQSDQGGGNVTFTYEFRTLTDNSVLFGSAQLTQTEADFDCRYSGPLNAVFPNTDLFCHSFNPSLTGTGCHVDLDVTISPII